MRKLSSLFHELFVGRSVVRYRFFAAVLLVLSLLLLHAAFRKGGLFDTTRRNDFQAYHQAARHALDGRLLEAYTSGERPYQYPPTLASLILPLGWLPYRVALVIWVGGSLALLLVSFRWLDEVLCPPVGAVDKFVGFLFVYRFVHSDFANTNANTIILALLVAGFLLARRSRPLAAGAVLALAACIKVTPVLLLPWLVYKRRPRLLLGFAAGLLLWGVVVSGLILGVDSYRACASHWWQTMVAPHASSGDDGPRELPRGEYVAGQSFRSLAYRLLRETDATAHDEDSVAVNIAHWPQLHIELVYWASSVVLLGGALLAFWRRGHRELWSGPEIALAILLTVLLSPLARKAHFVVLLPAAAMAFAIVRAAKPPRRHYLAVAFAAAFVLVVASSPGALPVWLSKRVMAFCPLAFASVLLASLLVVPPLAGWKGRPRLPDCLAAAETSACAGPPATEE